MYTSSLQVTYDNIDELLNASLYLRIQAALDACTNFLLENLTSETCLRTLSVAISFDMEDVFERACQQVANNFVQLSFTDEFLDLSEETLLCLVSRDDLHVEGDLEVGFTKTLSIKYTHTDVQLFTALYIIQTIWTNNKYIYLKSYKHNYWLL